MRAAFHGTATLPRPVTLHGPGHARFPGDSLVLVAYVAAARQSTVDANLATAYADTARAMAALTEERRQVLAAAGIASADYRRAMAAEDAAEASTKRLRELEAWLSANADGSCTTADDARRLRDL